MSPRSLSLLVLILLVAPCLATEVDFKTDVYPILTRHCTKCHGEDKQAGELALHLPSAIEDFGVVTAGDPDASSLYDRITLPADDEMSMPKGSAPLDANEIERIREWIASGAAMPADDDVVETLEEKYNLPTVPPAAPDAIAAVETAGGAVVALYGGSPLLQVSFAHGSSPATDGSLECLAGIAPQVVSLNLGRSAVTDEGLAALSSLENLMRLHLENTAVTDEGLAYLSGLKRLEYLNLYGTTVSDAGLAHLNQLTQLRKLFLWQTEVSYDAAMALAASIPGLEVNLGWNHPEVKKAREARMAELAAQREAESEEADELSTETAEDSDRPKDEAEGSDPDDSGSDGSR